MISTSCGICQHLSFPFAIKQWNRLPKSVIHTRNVEEFKMMIGNHYGDITINFI